MRYGIFSDIHGNRQAWNAVLDDMRASNVDVPVCLGDIVGYGPCPQQVLDGIREVTENFLLGNHDAAATGILDASIFNDNARAVIEWTRDQLNEEALDFLGDMPLMIEDEDRLFVHAEIEEPGRFYYIDSEEEAQANFPHCEQRVIFVGHTHDPTIFEEKPDGSVERLVDVDCRLEPDRRYIVNVGSVGEPRNPEDIRARYVIYDSETNELLFRRVDFDIEGYRRDLQASGLSIIPYFLKVVDSHREAADMAAQAVGRRAMMMDMNAPRHAPVMLRRTGGERRVAQVRKTGVPLQRIPVPTPVQKTGPSPGIIVTWFSILLFAILGGVYFYAKSKHQAGESIVGIGEEKGRSPTQGGSLSEMVAAEVGAPATGSNPAISSSGGSILNPTPLEVDTAPVSPIPEPAKVGAVLGTWNIDAHASAIGNPMLANAKAGKKAAPLVAKIPKSGAKNGAAASGGVWKEIDVSNQYTLRVDRGFTFECWFSTGPVEGTNYIAGDRSDDSGEQVGWQIDARSLGGQQLSFVYDPGEKASVYTRVPAEKFFDGKPHHLAVVWDHQGTEKPAGKVTLYIDGRSVGELEINHDIIDSTLVGKRFSLGGRLIPQRFIEFPGTLDHALFTAGPLKPEQFQVATKDGKLPGATASIAAAKPPEKPADPKPAPDKGAPAPPPEIPQKDIASLSTGLVFYAPFDAAATSNPKRLFDLSGRGWNSNLGGVTIVEKGKVGQSAQFSKKSMRTDKVVAPGKNDEVTLAFWIKLDKEQEDKESPGNLITADKWFQTRLDHVSMQVNFDTNGNLQATNLKNDGKFTHVIIQNAKGNTTVFINNRPGRAFAEKTKAKDPNPIPIIMGSGMARFQLDEVAVWNRALTKEEKSALIRLGNEGRHITSIPETIAHWKFDDSGGSRILKDQVGKHDLGAYQNWQRVKNIAPDKLPLTLEKNEGAATVALIAERPENAKEFELEKGSAFTFEGWFTPGRFEQATLGSTIEGNTGGAGWRVALKKSRAKKGYAAFMYQAGDEKFQALSEEIEIYDEKPHHFAARWLPNMSGENGKLQLYIDGKVVANAELPRSKIVEGESSPFQIGRPGELFTVDEFRFTRGYLKPGLFLSSGAAIPTNKP